MKQPSIDNIIKIIITKKMKHKINIPSSSFFSSYTDSQYLPKDKRVTKLREKNTLEDNN